MDLTNYGRSVKTIIISPLPVKCQRELAYSQGKALKWKLTFRKQTSLSQRNNVTCPKVQSQTNVALKPPRLGWFSLPLQRLVQVYLCQKATLYWLSKIIGEKDNKKRKPALAATWSSRSPHSRRRQNSHIPFISLGLCVLGQISQIWIVAYAWMYLMHTLCAEELSQAITTAVRDIIITELIW